MVKFPSTEFHDAAYEDGAVFEDDFVGKKGAVKKEEER